MLQRIQTIYLLLAAACSVSLLFLPIYFVNIANDTDVSATFGAYGLVSDNLLNTEIPLYLLFILWTMLSIIAIFLYKNRKKQLLVCRINLLLQFLIAIGFLLFSFFGKSLLKEQLIELGHDASEVTFSMGIGYFCLFLGIPFLLLAIRGIRNDEQLLKSLDRLR
ncbi:DUF4293 domain-containing protein [Putridiphycobacter roseus]|uniref:DUF4293 domain-containing protein n=1 Tax=Putridiphycobacter roseus TaxID=2219161 RepID=A0A2W1NBP3_9FLAO|nr:DUF4293 domain-containing protein [Putridiphycobacter roseus]PZE16503.1 DUF4293 domain-containing protein [Putridiphycobacter roseus]